MFSIATSAVLVALLIAACDRKDTPVPTPSSPVRGLTWARFAWRMPRCAMMACCVLCIKATGEPFTGTLHEYWPSWKTASRNGHEGRPPPRYILVLGKQSLWMRWKCSGPMAELLRWENQPLTVIMFSGLDCPNKLGMSPTRARHVIKGSLRCSFRPALM